jgi:hypothetical protein
MWVNRKFFEMVIADNKAQADKLTQWQNTAHVLQTKHDDALAQKVKDDLNIDWLRHRVNALEKQNALMLAKVAGIHVPVPEIVPTRPGTVTPLPAGFDHLPSFEDVGDDEAARLGVRHDDLGFLDFKADHERPQQRSE